ncbi:hypothetical protein [Phaeobacter inhibens]|uniref:hypothetical protein n=1 Tax=Phaeobacter inhibens TaxID=221822 RepID=UPI0020C7C9E1|nr:hypothetical protein [Phaeobacter inhibens]
MAGRSRNLIAAIAAIIITALPSFAHEQPYEGDILLGSCLPPEDPYPFEPPEDPELRAMINEEYQQYIRDAEDYINCLRQEHGLAIRKTNEILNRYVELFGREAALRSTGH